MQHPYVTVPIFLGILGFQITQAQAQSETTTTSQTIPVAGTVLDADTHQPIPGATIVLQDPSGKMLGEQRVGANGEFRLAVVRKQQYTLNAKAFGYDANSKQLSFTSDLTDAIKGYPVELHKAVKAAATPSVAPRPQQPKRRRHRQHRRSARNRLRRATRPRSQPLLHLPQRQR
ncbi:carboxypeptidase-like regulatory domain-containing protein [Spirosoma rhododendri]|uniref:Carboxypeptidase-like regulatory domain-containing protein n=1 Tax=Spirosoma rhododendri TaxID=2728024 RepID=A0A7L5DPR8_9BACT|nr:carboxypeptidase-like regulatory domain-containing protein [Spirosoma rhododendri]